MTRGALGRLAADLDPAAAAVALPVVLEGVTHTKVTTGHHHHPPAAAGPHRAAAGPAHILAVTDTPPGADAEITVDIIEGIATALLRATTGHTLAPTAAHPLWRDPDAGTTDPDLGRPATAEGTAERANTGASFLDPLPGLSEAGQDPDRQNALLP